MFWDYPSLALVLLAIIGIISGMGVITSVGAASEALSCRKRHWWVRFVDRKQLVYEERTAERTLRSVAFGCAHTFETSWKVVGWEVNVPSSGEWDTRVPEWAQGRRDEILRRIVDAFGGGTPFLFRDVLQAPAADERRLV